MIKLSAKDPGSFEGDLLVYFIPETGLVERRFYGQKGTDFFVVSRCFQQRIYSRQGFSGRSR